MNGAPAWEPKLLNLWPTLLTRAVLTDHETHNDALIELVERMDTEAEQMTSRYQAVDIFSVEEPCIAWLREGIDAAIDRYLTSVGVDYGVRWKVRGWANVNRRGDYHSPHNHGWSYLSGTYYVRVPEQPDGGVPGAGPAADAQGARPAVDARGARPAVDARGARPAAISFYDPRGTVNMLARAGEGIARREHPVTPTPGTMMLWNAFLNHSVHPNLAEVTRITISFNVALAWTDELA